jgi:hypothetical protein
MSSWQTLSSERRTSTRHQYRQECATEQKLATDFGQMVVPGTAPAARHGAPPQPEVVLVSHRVLALASGSCALALSACASSTPPTAVLANEEVAAAATADVPYISAHTAALPGLDDTALSVIAMNDFAEIVGTLSDNPGHQAFKYQTTRGLTLLPQSSTSGQTTAAAVNNDGQVAVAGVGIEFVSSSAGIWDWFGGVTFLRPLSTVAAAARFLCAPSAINNLGVVGGSCPVGPQNNYLATVWTKFGTPWALRTKAGALIVIGSEQFAPFRIGFTDSGYASGPSIDGTGFVLSPAGDLRVVPEPVINGVSFAIQSLYVNNVGQAAGLVTARTVGLCNHAIVSMSGSSVVDLGCGGLFGINDDGIAVGTVNSKAVLWTAATGLRRLPGLEGGAAQDQETGLAIAVNQKGQIVGQITMTTGVTHKVLWTLPSGPLTATLAVAEAAGKP